MYASEQMIRFLRNAQSDCGTCNVASLWQASNMRGSFAEQPTLDQGEALKTATQGLPKLRTRRADGEERPGLALGLGLGLPVADGLPHRPDRPMLAFKHVTGVEQEITPAELSGETKH
jgi:hypothetical protein